MCVCVCVCVCVFVCVCVCVCVFVCVRHTPFAKQRLSIELLLNKGENHDFLSSIDDILFFNESGPRWVFG